MLNLQSGPPPTEKQLLRMASVLGHRGPDGTRTFVRPTLGLAHTRLSIIDLEGGWQPIANEDQSIWVVFNGEIFNYIELRETLKAQGHQFRTQSDTEVLVHLYEQHGLDFPEHLNGQFAIALWDDKQQRLVLVRDRVGILPLFYTEQSGRLFFASEIKALLAAIGTPAALDPVALGETMTFWSPMTPHTLFPGVLEVTPGQMLIAERGEFRKRRYWSWSFAPEPVPEPTRAQSEAQIAELKALLIDATRIRLRADVPVAAYLSGGLDSSVLTTLIKNYSSTPLRTFSIRFEDKSLDETEYQDELIARLGAEHSHVLCGPGDIARAFADAVWHAEAPMLRAAPVPMMLLSGLVHRMGYKVVLTGEGSDEVLGGYDIFKEAKIRWFWSRRPESKLRPLLLGRLYPYLDVSPARAQAYLEAFFRVGIDQPDDPVFSHLPRWLTTSRSKEFLSARAAEAVHEDSVAALRATLPAEISSWHPLRRAQYLECTSLLAGYLLCTQGDRMLMANSVEGRFPFLDHRLIEFASRLHPTLLIKVLCEKYALKQAMKGEIPPRIIRRTKQPYRAPDIPAFVASGQGGLREEVRDLLAPSALERAGYFHAQKVDRLLKKVENGQAVGQKDNMAFMAILSTQLLHKQFIEEFDMHLRLTGIPAQKTPA